MISQLSDSIEDAWEALKHVPIGNKEAYDAAYQNWSALRNTCPSCLTTDHVEIHPLRNCDELWCAQCGVYIRKVYY